MCYIKKRVVQKVLYNFVECYTTWLKDGIYAVINMSVEILMHIQIFIPVKESFFLKGIQQFDLIIHPMNK